MIEIGLTLPSFVEDPEVLMSVARAAEDAKLDAVFAYEHLFRVAADGTRRPALDAWATLGAVGAETQSLRIGTLVARATLRPAAVLAHACETLQRTSGGRMIAVVGAGDRESRPENEEFGLPFGTLDTRVAALREAIGAIADVGVTTWVGGTHARVLEVAAQANGWNRWGGDVDSFAHGVAAVRGVNTEATITWGGLVVLDESDTAATSKAKRLGAGAATMVGAPATIAAAMRPFVAAGADWLILAPVDSSNPANAELVAAIRSDL
jgi:alkanesulfonate monooxygenase SsuD/methylene tetrahydromethanopterin reductase-like flavin-dependent oxidoreductase (luciferase family)